MRLWPAIALLSFTSLTGCATARIVGAEPVTVPDPGGVRVVVIEPFFETADWQVTTRTEQGQAYGQFGVPQDVTVTRQVAEKPVYARIPSLAEEQRQVLMEIQKLRPTWRVISTGALPAVDGPMTLVRTVISGVDTVESDRALKNLACGFGIILPPLLLLNLSPVHETQRINGGLVRFDTDAATVRARLLRYPTQPDFAVDTRGLDPHGQAFGLDVAFEEGVMAREDTRDPVVVGAFSRKLAAAVVALVEEQR
jgi:hypothetical protein